MHDIVRKSRDSRLEAPVAPDLSANDGAAMHDLISELYPICRSITGNGVRKTIDMIGRYIPLTTCELPSGTEIFDWTVPFEWNIREAYIKDSLGGRIVDFRRSNLHVVSYSTPVHRRMDLTQLKEHLHSDPAHPDWIPYRTSYDNATWGFCLPHNQMLALSDEEYEVFIELLARARSFDLWRPAPAGAITRRGAHLLSLVPSVAV